VIDVLADGSVRVAAGPLKLVVASGELRATPEPAPPPKRASRPKLQPSRAASLESPVATSDNSCDLRGLRVDDAVSLAMSFLDRAINEGHRVAFLVHGHGTGALRDAIRKELRGHRSVTQFRSGSTEQGGEGVTVVWLET
jgi:DNA mismatch repair protein MutS2